MAESSEPNAATPKPRPRRSRLRRLGVWTMRVIVLLAIALAVVTQSGVLAWLVLPRIEAALGCEAYAGRVSVTPRGKIRVNKLRLASPGLDGIAATFLEVEALEIEPRWIGLLSGTIPVNHVHALRPVFRLSQDKNLNFNLPTFSGGGDLPSFVPAVDLTDAVLDFGEHGRGWYTPLVTLRVAGRLACMGPDSPRYEFQLVESVPATTGERPEPLTLKGQFDLSQRTGFLTMDRIDLTRWRSALLPERVRDYWAKIALRGAIKEASLSYTPKDGPVVAFSLADVNLNVPVPAESEEERRLSESMGQTRPADALLAMNHVSGNLRFERGGMRATLSGLIEDLPCTVTLTTEGYDPRTSPLTCHIASEKFKLEDRPRLLPFAPFYVKRNFARFSGPRGMIWGEVTLRRGEPSGDVPSPLQVNGRLGFEQGEAAFEKFIYPFHALKGTIDFDETQVRILDIAGLGPTGAKLLARGRVAPPNDDGEVEVDVTVVDVPVDAHLRDAVPPRRKGLLEYLFSEVASRTFREAGLAEPAEFALGGSCEIKVRITRAFGGAAGYRTTIDVGMDRAGLLSAAFPYPVVAQDLRLRITDDDLLLVSPRMTGPGGASMSLEARATLSPPGEPDLYDVRVAAANLRCDDALLRALPSRAESGAKWSPQSFVRALGLSGLVDGEARVHSRTDGTTGWVVHAAPTGLSASIGGDGCLQLANLAGDLVVSDEDAHVLGLSGSMGDGEFTISLGADRQASGAIGAGIGFSDLDVRARIEEVVRLVAPDVAARMDQWRRAYDADGVATGRLVLSPGSATPHYELSFDSIRGASCRVLGGRLALVDPEGPLRVSSREGVVMGMTSRLTFDGEPAGIVRLGGVWTMNNTGTGRADIRLDEGRFESGLIRAAARTWSPRLGAHLDSMDVSGSFTLTIERLQSGSAATLTGDIAPTSLSLRRNGQEICFQELSGRIRFGTAGGEVADLRGQAPNWSLSAAGRWATEPALDIDLSFGFESQGIPPDLVAALPPDAAEAFRAVRLDVAGPLRLRESRLRSEEDGERLRLTAKADAGETTLDIGVPVHFESATADLDVLWPLRDDAPPAVRAALTIPRFSASKAVLTQGVLEIRSVDQPGAYEVSGMGARMHGGSLWATAAFAGATHRADDNAAGTLFAATIQAAGVDFASVLNDFREDEETGPESLVVPGTRGEIDATISVSGRLGSGADRRGRGQARISGGEVIALPGAMGLLRLSNLQPPMGEPLESATASFYLKGDTVTLERLQASSESLLIVGAGTMTLPDTELDLRFNTQGRGTIPLLDDVLRGLRNEIVTTTVTGTARQPEYHLEAFSGTQRMLGTIFGGRKGKAEALSPIPPDQEPK